MWNIAGKTIFACVEPHRANLHLSLLCVNYRGRFGERCAPEKRPGVCLWRRFRFHDFLDHSRHYHCSASPA